MRKEKLLESERTKAAIAAILAEILLLFGAHYGLDVPPETVNVIAGSIAGVAMTWIAGRSYRNTPTIK